MILTVGLQKFKTLPHSASIHGEAITFVTQILVKKKVESLIRKNGLRGVEHMERFIQSRLRVIPFPYSAHIVPYDIA